VAAAAADHARFLSEIALVPRDASVDALLKVLVEGQGQAGASPWDRAGLHPLLVPLAADPSAGGGGALTCLLRWPEGHTGMEVPVVRQARGATSVELLARSAAEYLHRALAEEEAAGGGGQGQGPVAAAAGPAGAALYERGAFARSGLPSMRAYLARSAGMYCDVAEALAAAHLARGDALSALITAEWYTRDSHFPGWGRPYEFNAALLTQVRGGGVAAQSSGAEGGERALGGRAHHTHGCLPPPARRKKKLEFAQFTSRFTPIFFLLLLLFCIPCPLCLPPSPSALQLCVCAAAAQVGRLEEARDVARVALRTPWWSLRDGFAAARDAAGLAGGAADVRAALDAQEEMANGGVLQGQFRTNPKTPRQARVDAAAHLMDAVAAGEGGWDEVRRGVADEYRAAGMEEMAAFVEA
jgi:hypothetical protein